MSDEEFTKNYDMVMPFVTVTSKGGPHDDDAYVAGFEMGRLDSELEYTTWPLVRTIRTENVPQADLIAMRHGFRMEAVQSQWPEWSGALFTPEEGK
jgi:hypothetical protein